MSRRTSRRDENTSFICTVCGCLVMPLRTGGFRNHCPSCLWSLHVDQSPGDRASQCGAEMEPIGVSHHRSKGWMIEYRCTGCGLRSRNRAALDDPVQPDDSAAIGGLGGLP